MLMTTKWIYKYSEDGPLIIENAIIDKLGKGDIKWEYLGEMNDPRIKQNNL